ncbi:hypothetical protein BGZ94_006765, partial [Podila epigama]
EHLRQFAYDVTDVLTTSAPTPFGANYDWYNEYDDDENALTTDVQVPILRGIFEHLKSGVCIPEKDVDPRRQK